VVHRYRSRISLTIAIAALVFTACCLILPEVSTNQTIVEEGPTTPYGQADYTFSGYVIPPVPAHSQIVVAIDGYLPNSLTFAMYPTAAVSGWYLAHPEAHYFPLGKIARDQVEDYARRKEMPVEQAEKWLSSSLGYEA